MIAKRLVAHGRVQGVWYRASTEEQARALALKGWVRNVPDGTVEVHAEGDEEAIHKLIAWMQQGPPLARVTHIEQLPAQIKGFSDFNTKY